MTTLISHQRMLWAATLVSAGLWLAGPAQADMLLSSFEGDRSSTVGPAWSTGLAHSYVAAGATDGATAIEITHNTAWTQDFLLDGAVLAPIVATSDRFELDATTPESTSWRQVFVVLQGDGQPWGTHQFDLTAGATTHVSLDLAATGIKASAAAGGQSWWQIVLIFQGGDASGASQIQTTIDNIRFTTIPEPATLILAVAAVMGLGVARRQRFQQ